MQKNVKNRKNAEKTVKTLMLQGFFGEIRRKTKKRQEKLKNAYAATLFHQKKRKIGKIEKIARKAL